MALLNRTGHSYLQQSRSGKYKFVSQSDFFEVFNQNSVQSLQNQCTGIRILYRHSVQTYMITYKTYYI